MGQALYKPLTYEPFEDRRDLILSLPSAVSGFSCACNSIWLIGRSIRRHSKQGSTNLNSLNLEVSNNSLIRSTTKLSGVAAEEAGKAFGVPFGLAATGTRAHAVAARTCTTSVAWRNSLFASCTYSPCLLVWLALRITGRLKSVQRR